jgi:hypothetical protein
MDRVSIQWTDTARSGLAKLPPDARRGLLDKASKLRDATNLADVCQRLAGPLRDYHEICFSRYRAPYSIKRQKLPDGNCWVCITFRFVTEGKRGQGAKEEIYRYAEQLLKTLEPSDIPVVFSQKKRR